MNNSDSELYYHTLTCLKFAAAFFFSTFYNLQIGDEGDKNRV